MDDEIKYFYRRKDGYLCGSPCEITAEGYEELTEDEYNALIQEYAAEDEENQEATEEDYLKILEKLGVI